MEKTADSETAGGRGASERALRAATEILARWLAERDALPLDRITDSEFRARRYLNSGERRWVGAAVYGVVRHFSRQKSLLEALHLPETAENLIRSWADAPADSETAPVRLPHTPPLSDAQTWQAALDSLPTPDALAACLRETLSFPDALAAELERLLGAESLDAARAFNRAAPVTLRVNTLRATRERVLRDLPGAAAAVWSPSGVHLPQRVNLPSLPGFREGRFEAQEEASQLVALLAAPQPGQRVADVGAGAGGKTLALAAQMQNRGRLLALDVSARRLEELTLRAKRAGASNIEILAVPADSEGRWQPIGPEARILEKWNRTADCVLLDAPCTGSGVIRRAPDTKWRGADIAAFARLQSVLLEQASVLTAPGGTLCYATCAVEAAQNEAVVEAFLKSEMGRDFEIAPLLPLFAPFASGPYFRSWPHRHTTDAFFAAKLQRKGVGVRGSEMQFRQD